MQFHRKTSVLGSLFNKVANLKVCNFLKNRLQHRCFLWILQNCLRIAFLYNTSGGCCWKFYHGTVMSAGVPVLWFRASTCFRFWSKTFTKRCTNNSLLSSDKTTSCLLGLISHVHLISEYVLENINCFRFWWNTYTKRCASNCNITCQNTFFPCTLRLVRCFQFQDIILKMEECSVSKNIALKTWRWKSWFWFCSAYVYFADLKTIYIASCLCCSSKF